MSSHYILLVTASFIAIICSLTTASDPSPLQDFCVADTATSVACMDPKHVNADHFFFSGLHVPSNTSNSFGFNVTFATIPGLNTLGISLLRVDIAPKGVVPPHTHSRATEVVTVLEGTLFVGFVTANPEKRLISKTLQKGDVFVIPLGLHHFLHNVGSEPASGIIAFSSQSPGLVLASDLFGTNPSIPDDILAKSYKVDESTIHKLRSQS